MLYRKALKTDTLFIAECLKDILALHANGREDIFNLAGGKYTASDIENMLGEDNIHIFIAEDCGEKLGYAICYVKEIKNDAVLKDRVIFYLDDLYLLPVSRGKGGGNGFMEFLLDYAKSLGCDSFELNVWEFDGSAVGFYKKCGFQTQKRTMEKTFTNKSQQMCYTNSPHRSRK